MRGGDGEEEGRREGYSMIHGAFPCGEFHFVLQHTEHSNK